VVASVQNYLGWRTCETICADAGEAEDFRCTGGLTWDHCPPNTHLGVQFGRDPNCIEACRSEGCVQTCSDYEISQSWFKCERDEGGNSYSRYMDPDFYYPWCMQGMSSTSPSTDFESANRGEHMLSVEVPGGVLAKNITCGLEHCCTLLVDGRVMCWGNNRQGQLGTLASWPGGCVVPGGFQGDQSFCDTMVAVDLGQGRTALAVKAGSTHNCALLDNNRIKCWGENRHGQLGHGHNADSVGNAAGEMGDDLPYVDFGSVEGDPLTATSIAVGGDTSCALLLNKRVKCWGLTPSLVSAPEDYQWTNIGKGEPTMGNSLPYVDLGDDPVADIECAQYSCCAVFENGRSKCWGMNEGGLGAVDPSSNNDEPMRDTFHWAVSRVPFTELGPGSEVTQILPHKRGGCALLSDGRVKCWGQCPFSTVLHRRLRKEGARASSAGEGEWDSNLP